MQKNDFEQCLKLHAQMMMMRLHARLEFEYGLSHTFRAERLEEAMRYALLGGGKHIRSFLCVQSASLFNVLPEHALRVGEALECLHTYSLVHDDLPSMDNDDTRRGRATVHVAFDEATAILAGDALQTLAFEILSEPMEGINPQFQLKLCGQLAKASGVFGMAGGQMLDLTAEGRFGVVPEFSQTYVEATQKQKTGALLRASLLMGATLGGADEDDLNALIQYGDCIGLAFQIADDLLDEQGDAKVLGKAVAKDASLNKATWVKLLGIEGAQKTLKDLVDEACGSLSCFGSKAQLLKDCARFIAYRTY